MKNLVIIACWALIVSFAAAQNSNNSNPSNGSDESSLSSALKLIQDRVNKQGEIRYTMTSKNTASGETVQDKYVVETSKMSAHAHYGLMPT